MTVPRSTIAINEEKQIGPALPDVSFNRHVAGTDKQLDVTLAESMSWEESTIIERLRIQFGWQESVVRVKQE